MDNKQNSYTQTRNNCLSNNIDAHERISDVIISRTFWERLFGFGSICIQSLAG
ncbi:MAG: PH domain-containing protein [Candidatus Aenigmarchaeota archaeon]|nr:PH domain-containing protein [Candidatus Aenigmarchaeota archaeon]